jgi:hypothetical protein
MKPRKGRPKSRIYIYDLIGGIDGSGDDIVEW